MIHLDESVRASGSRDIAPLVHGRPPASILGRRRLRTGSTGPRSNVKGGLARGRFPVNRVSACRVVRWDRPWANGGPPPTPLFRSTVGCRAAIRRRLSKDRQADKLPQFVLGFDQVTVEGRQGRCHPSSGPLGSSVMGRDFCRKTTSIRYPQTGHKRDTGGSISAVNHWNHWRSLPEGNPKSLAICKPLKKRPFDGVFWVA
jgi:hypothetical protein